MKVSTGTLDQAIASVVAVVPDRAHDLARLRTLALGGDTPVVTVVGKYNHGKSRLLNELMGRDVFAVADKRETVALAEHRQLEVRWLDAPGLDADVGGADDGHAYRATWLEADVRLFVHAAKEGELDAAERSLAESLRADQVRTQRQTLFVLTQVDQLADEAQVDKVLAVVQAQVPQASLYPVSSTRHRQGTESGKSLFVQKSGVPALQVALREAISRVPQARQHERGTLLDEMRTQLLQEQQARTAQLQALQTLQQRQREDFDQGLLAVLDKIQVDLQAVVDHTGEDPALMPDTVAFEFKLTAGKKERARLQIAYSRACIAIRSHLVRHGALGLPAAQQTSVRSLDTVMVAVMGVSVKYRDDLRRIFFEQAGRARLAHDFAHYFEQSDDRVALVRQLDDSTRALADAAQALQGLAVLEQR
jgi:predicted GTPase